jgi:hypothetical protein
MDWLSARRPEWDQQLDRLGELLEAEESEADGRPGDASELLGPL